MANTSSDKFYKQINNKNYNNIIKDKSTLDFINSKLYDSKHLLKVVNEMESKRNTKYAIPEWRSINNDSSYKNILYSTLPDNSKLLKSLNKQLNENKNNMKAATIDFKKSITKEINDSKSNLKGGILQNKKIKVKLSNSISFVGNEEAKQVRSIMPTKKASQKVNYPLKNINYNSPILHINDKNELINKIQLSDDGPYHSKMNNAKENKKDVQKSELSSLFDVDFSLLQNDEKKQKFKKVNKVKTAKTKLGSFNDYLIRNYVFLDNTKRTSIAEARRQWNVSEDFFDGLKIKRLKQIKKNAKDNDLLEDLLEDLSGFINLNEKYNAEKILKEEKIKKQKKMMETRRLQEEILDISGEYERVKNPINDMDFINKNNFIREIKRKIIEKKFNNPLRKNIMNPSQTIQLRKQEEELNTIKGVLIRKVNFLPNFIKEKVKLNTLNKFSMIRGKSFGKTQTGRILN